MLKMIINNEKTKLYIDTKDISAFKSKKTIASKKVNYFIYIYLKSGQILTLDCNETEFDDIIKRLNY